MDWRTFGHKKVKEKLERTLFGELFNHTFLFIGPDGIGKRTLALEVAEKLFGTAPESHPDFSFFDAKELKGVEEVRGFLGTISGKPFAGGKRVVILDNIQELSVQGENALLKVLEEPPMSSVLILISSVRPLATILSRCDVTVCQSLSPEEMGAFSSKNKIQLSPELLTLAVGKPGLLTRMASDKKLFQKTLAGFTLFKDVLSASLYERIAAISALAAYDDSVLQDASQAVLVWVKTDLRTQPTQFFWLDRFLVFSQSLQSSANKKISLQQLLLV